MSIIKSAIQGGAHSNLPSAWKNSHKLGPKSNIPLAKGLKKGGK